MKLTYKELQKIKTYIKNKIDISELIKNKDIRNLDLSYARIKDFNRINDDISGVNLSYAIIGEEGKITNLSGTIMHHCNFRGAKFLGKVFMRRVDARYSKFRDCYMPYAEIQYSDFRNCDVCGWILPFHSLKMLKTKWSKEHLEYCPLPILFNLDKVFKVVEIK